MTMLSKFGKGLASAIIAFTLFFIYCPPAFSAACPVGKWQKTTPLPEAWSFAEMGHAALDWVYVTAGVNGPGYRIHYAVFGRGGELGNWQETTSTPNGDGFAYTDHDRFLYLLGGRPNWLNFTDKAWYAKISDDGSLSQWFETQSLPDALFLAAAFVNSDFIYLLGGAVSRDGEWIATDGAYFAKVTPGDGIGQWEASTSLPRARFGHHAVVYNGFVYVIGGRYAEGPGNSALEVIYAPVKDSGHISDWVNANPLPDEGHMASLDYTKAFAAAGCLYVLKRRGANYKAVINQDGSLGEWESWDAIPFEGQNPTSAGNYAFNPATGIVYSLGGWIDGEAQTTVFRNQLACEGCQ